MAYYFRWPRYYRPRGYRRRRYQRRSYYRRPRYGRRYRRRRMVRRRRPRPLTDRGRYPQTVTQYRPRYHTRCKISGYMPLMFALGAQAGIMDIQLPSNKFLPHWLGGGVDSSTMTLLDLYWEEQFWRAYWSKSNQGYNMAKYDGCKITLWPQQFFSYIFWWSTEDLVADNVPLTFCHPSQMILARQHVVIPRYYGQFRKRPVVIKIKPPTKLLHQWYLTKDIAKEPLVKWRASLIDFETPWTGFINKATVGVPMDVWMFFTSDSSKQQRIYYFPIFDAGGGMAIKFHQLGWNAGNDGPSTSYQGFWPIDAAFDTVLVPFYIFAFGRPANFYEDTKDMHLPQGSNKNLGNFLFCMLKEPNNAWRMEDGTPIKKANKFYLKYHQVATIAASGPWVEKQIPDGVNFIMEYKFYFQWGGTPATKLPPTAPAEGGPNWPASTVTYRWPQSFRANIRDPSAVTDEVLGDEDYDSGGLITDAALRRITNLDLLAEEPKKRQMAWGYQKSIVAPQGTKRKRYYSPQEETEEETSEDDSSSSITVLQKEGEGHHHHKHRRKRIRKRLVRFLLDRGIRLHGLKDLSGRLRSNSI
ncbi:ORF1 [Neotofec virus RodL2_6]|uniref:Capsid protein n=1 Tax=Neotofec virus RodL2_6 TaxID=2929219 RepID=A0A976R776_9VIRU|nr:ORF1 [Neotofec virus RodL2_6]